MNIGIKDGAFWRRHKKLYPKEGPKTVWLMIACWVTCAISWAFFLKPIAYLTPVFVVWCIVGFIFYALLEVSRHYHNKRHPYDMPQV